MKPQQPARLAAAPTALDVALHWMESAAANASKVIARLAVDKPWPVQP